MSNFYFEFIDSQINKINPDEEKQTMSNQTQTAITMIADEISRLRATLEEMRASTGQTQDVLIWSSTAELLSVIVAPLLKLRFNDPESNDRWHSFSSLQEVKNIIWHAAQIPDDEQFSPERFHAIFTHTERICKLVNHFGDLAFDS